ncbi:MAG: Fic family protein [Calditrichaeota bacterium]|nr:MAG: Fic family protein [Calditrichota bacterium]MBL1205400.1 Fic family protein [Calditrichota bacterium]NOG45229.1 Fic family protein [Calditrichota bacterium]
MKLPTKPPNYNIVIKNIVESGNVDLLLKYNLNTTKQYYHWDKLKHLSPPDNLTNKEWWACIKYYRHSAAKIVPGLVDNFTKDFSFVLTDSISRDLHWLDMYAAGSIQSSSLITTPETRNTYLVKSLIEEAISSSQLEGASTTLPIAKEMIRQNRKPRDINEQMIFNNYHAMEFIREIKNESLTPEIILELHKLLTYKTLEKESKAGKYRTKNDKDDNVVVIDPNDGIILHIPSKASEVPQRVKALCHFANQVSDDEFVHPVIKSIVLHFMLAYIHPFTDGNGRTARALFYWSMANKKYWLMEFVSISRVIKQAPTQYGKAFLHTESDENDLTYFIIHQLKTIKQAIGDLFKYLDKKTKQLQDSEKLLEESKTFKNKLNFRQLTLLRHALKHPRFAYKISEHMNSHGIVYQTARNDLIQMAERFNLLIKVKAGKSFLFLSPDDLHERLKQG